MLLYSSEFECRIYKSRSFDFDIRTLPAVSVVYDVDIRCIVPIHVEYDVIVYYIREVTSLVDPFSTSKDDAASFFSVNEQTGSDSLINSTYISTNLKVITPFSEAMNRPVSRFDSTKAVHSINISSSGTDQYVALNFEDIEDFNNLEIVRPGITCAILKCIPNSSLPDDPDSFVNIIDLTQVVSYGVLSNLSLNQNSGNYTYCSFYYGILDIPNDSTTYYFSLTASSVGFMLIDGKDFISQTTANSVSPVSSSITFTKGHHTFLIKHYAYDYSTNDMVRLQFRTDPDDPYVDFSISNLASINVALVTFPLYINDLVNQSDFGDSPSALIDASLDSLQMKRYRPIIVLARKYSELLQNEFNRIYYSRNPDTVLSSNLLIGTLDLLTDGYDFPVAGSGIIMNCDRTQVESPFITYIYNFPVRISRIELRDAAYYGDTCVDGKQCKSITLSIVDALKERMRASDLRNLIDLPSCDNIQELQLVNNSDSYIRIIKNTLQDHINIVFTDAVLVREITIRDPIINSINWGALVSFKVFLKATEIVKIIDAKGEQSIINTIDNERLVEVDYDGLGYIPTIFNHKSISPDIQYGAEFVMFCLNISGSVEDVITLGDVFVVPNYGYNTVFNSDHLLNYRQLSQGDDRKFELVTDMSKTTHYSFCYVGYSTAQDVVMSSNFGTITVNVSNTGTLTLTNLAVDLLLPNIGTGYSCVNQNAQYVPVVGITSTGTRTSDPTLWDSNYARVLLNIPVSGSDVLTFSTNPFSNISEVPSSISLPLIDPTPVTDLNTPVILDNSHIIATSTYYGYYIYQSTDPNTSLVGSAVGWLSNGEIINLKFNIDHGDYFIANRLYIENYHHSGTLTTRGVRNISIYGTNSFTAFSNTEYSDVNDLTLLVSVEVAQHVAANTVDPQYFTIPAYTTAYRYTVIRIANAWNSTQFMGFRYISLQSVSYLPYPVQPSYTYLPDIIQLPLVSVKIPMVAAYDKEHILALTSSSVPTASGSSFDIPTLLTLATVSVTELTGITRNDIELVVDVSDIQYTFKCPFRVYDSNRVSLDTVGVNNDNSVTTYWSSWDGYRIRFRAPSLPGGMSTLFLIRVGNFQGDAGSFIPSVQSDMSYNYHFSGCLIDSITGANGNDGGIIYNSDKYLNYYRALQFVNGNSYARIPAITNNNNFSISFWFQTMSIDVGILCLTNTVTVPATILDLKFSISSSGYLVCSILSGGGATLVATDKIYSDNQWHHVVLTSSSTLGMKLYIDTNIQASSTILSRTITTNYALLGWSDSYFIGSIDEFRVYTKCLGPQDVITLNRIFDGTINDTEQVYQRTDIVYGPSSRITNLSDLSSLQGTPMCIYKYMDINETVVRSIGV